MRTSKVIIDFSKATDTELDQDAQAIVTAMTGNANLQNPLPSLAVVTAAITDYQTAMSNAANGGAADTEIKDQKREALEVLLRALGLFVEVQSAGDAAIMLSSGFKISKAPSPIGPLPKPTGFEVMPQAKGEVKLLANTINGARIYQFEYKLATATDWILKPSTKAKILLTGLESGKEYIFRMVPIGTSDVRVYSDEVRSFVL
ncbi:MAG: hypothetical protein ABI675_14265 [Chitinophagaceae bacterium]